MKVLLCHNFYQQPGGEDLTFDEEGELLEARGHTVLRYTRHNASIDQMSAGALAGKTLWNREVYRELQELIRRERPDIMHCTNLFPLISPAAYHAAGRFQVPVVQALHNYRLLCANAVLMRGGSVCEDCVGSATMWPAVRHACYRDSSLASAGVAAMIGIHRALKTWTRQVTLYYTLTEFARQKFIQGGMSGEQLLIKPNFVSRDPGVGAGQGGYVLFIGRLSQEKGVETLLRAWAQAPDLPDLQLLGDGPLRELVRAAESQDPRIHWLGHRHHEEAIRTLQGALCLVVPSLGYETFGRAVIEGFACGTPVVASRLGALRSLIGDGETGLLFPAGDAGRLAAAVHRLRGEGNLRQRLGQQGRREYEQKYTAEINYQQLLEIYRRAQSRSGREATRQPVAESSTCEAASQQAEWKEEVMP